VALDPGISALLDGWDVTDDTSLARLVAALKRALDGLSRQALASVTCPRVTFELETLSSTAGVRTGTDGAGRAVTISLPFSCPSMRELAFHALPAKGADVRAAMAKLGPGGPDGTWNVPPDWAPPPWTAQFRVSASFPLNAEGRCVGSVPCRLVAAGGTPPGVSSLLADFRAPAMPEGTCLLEHVRGTVTDAFRSFWRAHLGCALRASCLFDALAEKARLRPDRAADWPACGVATAAHFQLPGPRGACDLSVAAGPSFPQQAPSVSVTGPGGGMVCFLAPGELSPWSPAWAPDRMAQGILEVAERRTGGAS